MSKFIQMAIEQASPESSFAEMFALDDEGVIWRCVLQGRDSPFEEFYRPVIDPKPTAPKKEKGDNPLASRPESVTEDTWNQFKVVRHAKKRPLTKRALKTIEEEGAKAKLTLEETLLTCLDHGWAGFEATWVQAVAMLASPTCPNRVRHPEKSFMQACGKAASVIAYNGKHYCQECANELQRRASKP